MGSLAGRVRLAVLENQVRLALREVEEHLGEVAVRPREPRACVGAVVDGDGLVDETEAASVLCHVTSLMEGQLSVTEQLTFAMVYRELRISLSSSVP